MVEKFRKKKNDTIFSATSPRGSLVHLLYDWTDDRRIGEPHGTVEYVGQNNFRSRKVSSSEETNDQSSKKGELNPCIIVYTIFHGQKSDSFDSRVIK